MCPMFARSSCVPKIETILIKSSGQKPRGSGKPAVVIVGCVTADAVYYACGARFFRFPMMPERVRESVHLTMIMISNMQGFTDDVYSQVGLSRLFILFSLP